MRYLKKSRPGFLLKSKQEEPLHGVANLFDVALVFIVALLLSLMATYQILDFFNPESEITIMKKVENLQKKALMQISKEERAPVEGKEQLRYIG